MTVVAAASELGTGMAADMAEQPAVLSLLAARGRHGAVVPRPRGYVLAGRGSSRHAAEFGRLLFESACARPATVVEPGEAAASYAGWMAVVISQSGQTPGLAATLRGLRRAGAFGVAVTTDGHSPLARSADQVVLLETGPERAVPATKTFTASLAVLARLANLALDGLADAVADVLREPVAVDAAWDRWACIGGGLLRPIANEAALKLEEAALVVADAHSPAGFLHGPVAGAGPQRPALLLGPAAAGLEAVLAGRGSPVVVPPLPHGLADPLVAIAAAVRAQQVALALARARGVDPDGPPGLSKVTRA